MKKFKKQRFSLKAIFIIIIIYVAAEAIQGKCDDRICACVAMMFQFANADQEEALRRMCSLNMWKLNRDLE